MSDSHEALQGAFQSVVTAFCAMQADYSLFHATLQRKPTAVPGSPEWLVWSNEIDRLGTRYGVSQKTLSQACEALMKNSDKCSDEILKTLPKFAKPIDFNFENLFNLS